MIRLKRVYDPASNDDGVRLLVERLWPRGVKKTDLRLDAWLKDVAPSTELRRWFSHDPAKWTEFQQRYFAELDVHPETVEPILKPQARAMSRCCSAPTMRRITMRSLSKLTLQPTEVGTIEDKPHS